MKMNRFKKCVFYRYVYNISGVVAVEFAMVSLMFLAIVFGTIEIGRVLWTKSAIEYGVESTARYVLVHSTATDSDLIAYTKSTVSDMGVDSSLLTVSVTRETLSGVNIVGIDGTYIYSNILPFLPASWNNITLTVSSSIPVPTT